MKNILKAILKSLITNIKIDKTLVIKKIDEIAGEDNQISLAELLDVII